MNGETMKAAVLTAPGRFEIQQVPRPEIAPEEVLIRVRACGICGTDLRIYRHGHGKIELPAVIGHEIVGQVEEVGRGIGAGEIDYTPGSWVMVTPGIACGRCTNCLQGLFCTNKTSIAYHYPGGFAEFLRVPARGVRSIVFPLPDPLPAGQKPSDYVIAEPLACALNGLEQLGSPPLGGRGLVVGAGAIGLLLAKLLRLKGLQGIVVADIRREKLERAGRILPPETIRINNAEQDLLERTGAITGGRGFDVVIVACSSPEIQELSLELVGLYGRILYFAGLPPDQSGIRFDSNLLHYKLASVHGTYGSTLYQNHQAMSMIGSGLTAGICDARYPLEQISQAFEHAEEGRTLKPVIEP